eukprot:gene22227-29292_t
MRPLSSRYVVLAALLISTMGSAQSISRTSNLEVQPIQTYSRYLDSDRPQPSTPCCNAVLGGVSLGETRRQAHKNILGPESKAREGAEAEPWVEQVGLHPQVYYFHNFLTEEERSHIIRLAAPMMRRSTVVGEKGDSVVDEIRTSHGMFIRRMADPIIERVEKRIALMSQQPLVHQEDIQVLRYTKGQQYGAHYDSAYDNEDEGPHHRLATFYMYLSDVEEGGETAFPENSRWYDPSMANAAADTASSCAKGHVHAKPKAGDAVLFYSFFPNGTMDPASMHTGCPVIRGIKWGAPVWIHIDEFNPAFLGTKAGPEEKTEPGLCKDYSSQCEKWAAQGLCEKQPARMMGKGPAAYGVGTCRRACKACTPCSINEISCINKNRKEHGYLTLDR